MRSAPLQNFEELPHTRALNSQELQKHKIQNLSLTLKVFCIYRAQSLCLYDLVSEALKRSNRKEREKVFHSVHEKVKQNIKKCHQKRQIRKFLKGHSLVKCQKPLIGNSVKLRSLHIPEQRRWHPLGE